LTRSGFCADRIKTSAVSLVIIMANFASRATHAAALYCRVSTADQTCARQERELRAFAKKAGYKVVGVWKEIASGAKQERAERKKVLALAQARKVDVILVTELTRWGRSARFAARSLTCFKFRFVSSPQLAESISNWGLRGLLLNLRLLFSLHSRIPTNEGLPELVIEYLRPHLE
jgi:DNA invertase Pin-like site-specific DNA recombinase